MTKDEKLILLVEDREDDVLLIKRAFEKASVSNPFHVARNGQEAMDYLAGEGEFADRRKFPLPWLVLLDLKMPGVDGFEVLRWVRNVSDLRSLIVVVLTSSDSIRDVNRAYHLGANSFLVKPLEFGNAVVLTKLIHHYWLMHNLAPQIAGTSAINTPRADTK